MVSTGRLHRAGTARALQALGRFRTLIDGMGVHEIHVVATAAVRDASNGEEFVAEAANEISAPVRVLTGKEEARLAGKGVLVGVPDADGLVADLGGGSLEIIEVANGHLGQGATFHLGPLRLMDAAKGKIKRAHEIIAEQFRETKWLKEMKGRKLYLVGGIWRNFSTIQMVRENSPLSMLQGFEAPAETTRELAIEIAGLNEAALEKLPKLNARRREAMPYGAAVLARLIKATGVSNVRTSYYGVREGVLYEAMDKGLLASDPLLEGAGDINIQTARSPGHSGELHRWIAPLFEDLPPDLRRLELAACFLSDMSWRDNSDFKAKQSYDRILTLPIAGASHRDRCFLALTIYARYGGGMNSSYVSAVRKLLDEDQFHLASSIGLALRLAYRVSGAVAGLLTLSRIGIEEERLVMIFNREQGQLTGEIVHKRLAALAEALGLIERIDFE